LFDAFSDSQCFVDFFGFGLEFATMNVQKNQQGLDLNGKQSPLVYADDVSLLGESINIITGKCGKAQTF
jgi:hypothetical protein